MNKEICLEIKCKDYSTDGGEPAWCIQAGCPAIVAVKKCPKVSGEKHKEGDACEKPKREKRRSEKP
jgi:hypothetical protein